MNKLKALNWPEYLMEAVLLAIFMVSACVANTLLEYPGSPVHQALPNGFIRMMLMGMVLAITLIGIFYSPWGKRSGAHINPAVTLTFYRLGKVKSTDMVFYILFQCLGAVLGVLLVEAVLGNAFTDMPVRYLVTVPLQGRVRAFGVEIIIAFCLMTVVLHTTNRPRWAPYTNTLVGSMAGLYVLTAGPVSGFSMNPARTLASALPANVWTAFWIYLLAPVAGMLLAAEVYRRISRVPDVKCAKMHHHNDQPCIFHCNYTLPEPQAATSP